MKTPSLPLKKNLFVVSCWAVLSWQVNAANTEVCDRSEVCLHITGTLHQVIPARREEDEDVRRTVKYEVWSNGGLWKIKTYSPSLATVTNQVEYREVGTDGKVTYGLEVYNTNYTGPIVSARVEKAQVTYLTNNGRHSAVNAAVGKMITGQLPLSIDEGHIPLLWLAYASGCHLHGLQVSNLPPLFTSSDAFWRANVRIPAEWTLDARPPYAPVEFRYLNPGVAFTIDADEKGGQHAKAVPNGESYTNFTLSATGTTTVGGWAVPAAFEMRGYYPSKVAQGGRQIRLSWIRHCTTESVKLIRNFPDDRFIPSIAKKTYLDDLRDLDPTSPKIKAPVLVEDWPTSEEAVRLRAGQPAQEPVQEEEKKRSGIWLFIIATLLIGGAAVSSWARAHASKKQKQKTNQE